MKPLLRQNSGLALPITLLLVAFNVTVLIALFVYATTELSASRNAAGSASSRIMALNGIDLAGALIAANSTNNAYVSYQNITNISGARLETKIANVVPIAGAADPSFQRQITNPTALHSGFAAPGEGVDLNYATRADPNSGYILPRTNPVSSNWRNLHTNMFQMKWVNVYKGPSSDPTNLIGRFAFWVDDESTKLNINYSGVRSLYNNSDLATRYVANKLVGPRADKGTNQPLTSEFMGEMWPQWMELSGVAGLSRPNIIQILEKRGDFLDRYTTLFKPYYSLLETRLATLPPAPGGLGITNISQQSQLGFTATVFSREPEITYATGRPRFDLLNFTTNWANTTNFPKAESGISNAFIVNYPRFALKYSLPQFFASLRAKQTAPLSGANAATNFLYTAAGGETPNYNARTLPLINETELKLTSSSNGTTLEASVELIFMFKTRNTYVEVYPKPDLTIYDDLELKGSANAKASSNSSYTATIYFPSPITIENTNISILTLKPNITWFTNSKLKPTDTNLTGLFGVLKTKIDIPTSNPDKVSWSIPSNLVVKTDISYSPTSTNNLYQSVAATNLNVNLTWTNQLGNSTGDQVVFWWTSAPRGDQGVRGDPRLGLHSANLVTAVGVTGNLTGLLNSNPNATIDSLNTTNTWQPGKFEGEPLSPDITPPETFFATDRGPFHGQEFDDSYLNGPWFPSSGHLGEIPITTFKNGTHLAWSTPKFWGDGRTNMGDGQTYPPDWFMLDCVHTAMFPPNTNRIFTDYSTNSFVSYGRLNINGLKSFFLTPRGSSDRSDTIFDSALIGLYLKDFREQPASPWKTISKSEASRTNLLNYINNEALRRGSLDDPFLTGFDFTAHLAGNTNSTLTNVNGWEFYTPGKTNTSDSRIESLVRSLQQRVTSRGFQFSVFSLGQSLQVVKTGETYKTNVIGESYFQAVWERAPKHRMDGSITNASSGGAPPLRLLYMRELR